MQAKYAYVFSIGSKVVWSGETEETLRRRVKDPKDQDDLERFLEVNKVGHFTELPCGDMVFQIA